MEWFNKNYEKVFEKLREMDQEEKHIEMDKFIGV